MDIELDKIEVRPSPGVSVRMVVSIEGTQFNLGFSVMDNQTEATLVVLSDDALENNQGKYRSVYRRSLMPNPELEADDDKT